MGYSMDDFTYRISRGDRFVKTNSVQVHRAWNSYGRHTVRVVVVAGEVGSGFKVPVQVFDDGRYQFTWNAPVTTLELDYARALPHQWDHVKLV